jgi:hypothetical protein
LERTLNPFSEFKRIRIRILHLTSLDLQVIAMPCDVEPVIVKIAHAAQPLSTQTFSSLLLAKLFYYNMTKLLTEFYSVLEQNV